MSEVTICNLALSWLGADQIISLNDESTSAILCNANYHDARKSVLEATAWTFATKRTTLAQIAGAPVWPLYGVQYAIPADSLRILEMSENGFNSTFEHWVIESGRLLCNTQKVWVRYIWDVLDTSKFSPMFVQALAARLAADMSIPLTNDRVLQKDMWSLYELKVSGATTVDGLQGRRQQIRSPRLIAARSRF